MENKLKAEEFERLVKYLNLYAGHYYMDSITNWKINKDENKDGLHELIVYYDELEYDENDSAPSSEEMELFYECLESNESIIKYYKYIQLSKQIDQCSKKETYIELIEKLEYIIDDLNHSIEESENELVINNLTASVNSKKHILEHYKLIIIKIDFFDKLNKKKGTEKWNSLEFDKQDYRRAEWNDIKINCKQQDLKQQSKIFKPLN